MPASFVCCGFTCGLQSKDMMGQGVQITFLSSVIAVTGIFSLTLYRCLQTEDTL